MRMAMLSEYQLEHLERMLVGLDEVKSRINERSATFVGQVQENFERFGINTRLSQKQVSWLERLYTENVGPLD